MFVNATNLVPHSEELVETEYMAAKKRCQQQLKAGSNPVPTIQVDWQDKRMKAQGLISSTDSFAFHIKFMYLCGVTDVMSRKANSNTY